MQSPAALLIYVVLVLIGLVAPYVHPLLSGRGSGQAPADDVRSWVFLGAMALGAALLLGIGLTPWALVLLVFLLLSLRRDPAGGVGRFVAAVAMLAAAWWSVLPQALVPVILPAAAAMIMSRVTVEPQEASSSRWRAPVCWQVMAGTAVLGVASGLVTTPYAKASAALTAWHHWSAYIAPVEAWLAGGTPYHDFPIQYGLGPTVLLAATCGADCWPAAFWAAVLSNAVYFALLTGSTYLITARLSHAVRLLATSATMIACVVWLAYPSEVATSIICPSVAGLRFLPATALLFYVIRLEVSGLRRQRLGHALWLLAFVWSPESACFASVLWWPYLAVRSAANAPDRLAVLKALIYEALKGAGATLVALGVVVAIVRMISGGRATVQDFLMYVQNPPGPLPINPVGAVWLALAVIAVAAYVLANTARLASKPAAQAALLAFLGAGSYFLSRSHDNNIINLFPMMTVLLATLLPASGGLRERPRGFVQGFICLIFTAIITFPVSFNWTAWADGLRSDKVGFGPEFMISRVTPAEFDEDELNPADVKEALLFLESEGERSVLLIDRKMLIPRMFESGAGASWTSVNNVANFSHLPDAVIQRYVDRGAKAYRKPGWILSTRRYAPRWLGIFSHSYEIEREEAFGDYAAYRLAPRQTAG